jgi:hypothetical protein
MRRSVVTATLAVDFDGVIHRYSKGWQDGSIYDEPVPGAFPAIELLMERYAVFVHTTRSPVAVAGWITERSGIDARADVPGGSPDFWDTMGVLLVTSRKLPAVAYIDDRAIRFESWPQTTHDIEMLEARR